MLNPAQKSRPGWVPYGMTLGLDFENGRTYRGSFEDSLSVSAGVNGWAPNKAGIYTKQVNSNALRLTDRGAWVEEARTNVCLQNRDLTNAAWTKTNVTAAKDQTGVDGVVSSASSITATAGNGTCLQAITLASSARFQSAFVKRITGTGTIEMTMDNGATWTAVTVTADWTRVSIPTQTLANPTVGFRIVTSGDAIAVDFVQNENGVYITTPIATAGASVTRAADNITIRLTGPLGRILAAAQGTMLFCAGPTTTLIGVGVDPRPTLIGDGAPGFSFYWYTSNTSFGSNNGALGVTPDVTVNSFRTALSWGGAITASTSGLATAAAGTGLLDAGTWTLGSYNGAGNWFNGPIQAVYAGPLQLVGVESRKLSQAV